MPKFFHPSVSGPSIEKAAINWPECPWTCPQCKMAFPNHARSKTIATVEPPLKTTFYCAQCDFSRHFMATTGSAPSADTERFASLLRRCPLPNPESGESDRSLATRIVDAAKRTTSN